MIYGAVGIVGLGMALSSFAYERYPARVDGIRIDNETAYLFVVDACESNAPVVECCTDLSSDIWTRPAQAACAIGWYWVICVKRASGMCFYRAWRTQPITASPTCGGWDGRWG